MICALLHVAMITAMVYGQDAQLFRLYSDSPSQPQGYASFGVRHAQLSIAQYDNDSRKNGKEGVLFKYLRDGRIKMLNGRFKNYCLGISMEGHLQAYTCDHSAVIRFSLKQGVLKPISDDLDCVQISAGEIYATTGYLSDSQQQRAALKVVYEGSFRPSEKMGQQQHVLLGH